jgi:hypothetical protein
MKKIYSLLLLIASATFAYGQSQRLVLIEEFTGETCGPCASQNPGFNNILNANLTKAVSIKYQNNIPTTGPNFYTYNTADISGRTSYYGNNYSPHAFLDGNVWNDVAGNFNATLLNSRYAVASPFDITVTHDFSVAHDSIYTHSVIRATQAIANSTQLHARIVVTEKSLYGYTSPNGETYFEHVMRKMLPAPVGTALAATWNVGDSMVIDEAWKITVPVNPLVVSMPLWPELEVVTFVQDDATKEVLQTGLSEAKVTLDAGITTVTNVPIVTCLNTFTPSVTVKNYETDPVTSLDIEYFIDAQTPAVMNWVGTIYSGASAVIALPIMTVPGPGAHAVHVNITNANGTPDFVTSNNIFNIPLGQPVASVATFSEGFPTTTFPPADWVINNPDHSYTWTRSTAGGFGIANGGSAKIDFYSSPSGQVDEMYPLMPLDLTAASVASLTFSVAYRQYSTENDRLEVRVSTNCGATWISVYNKAGATLATTTASTTAFTPTLASQWRGEVVNLDAYAGQNNVLIAFKATSNFGNNAYVDDINLAVPLGIKANEFENAVTVYPNPAKDNLNINISLLENKSVNFILTDLSGKEIINQKAQGSKFIQTLDITNVAAGSYFLKVNMDGETVTRKVTVQ